MTRQDPEGFGHRAGANPAVPASLPRLPGFDHTHRLLRTGYGFIGKTCDRLGVDGFRARILLRDTVCLRGPEAAALLYGRSGLTRATPFLFANKNAIQQLEGDAHRQRKALFIRLVMAPARVTALVDAFEQAWLADLRPGAEVTVLAHANAALTRAVCGWAGLNLTQAQLDRMTSALSTGGHHSGPLLQRRPIRKLLHEQMHKADQGTPAATLARDLPGDIAATELFHILRGVTSVGRYIAFAAKALHEHPMWCELFRRGNTDYLTDFCEEVRRISPAMPFVAAIASEELVWQGAILPRGIWLFLDLFGTTSDARLFPAPDRFRPERMLDWQTQDDSFIPQGGGKVERSHRCPGEAATLALMVSAVTLLTQRMNYTSPPQDLSVALNRVPAQPASGVRIKVQRVS